MSELTYRSGLGEVVLHKSHAVGSCFDLSIRFQHYSLKCDDCSTCECMDLFYEGELPEYDNPSEHLLVSWVSNEFTEEDIRDYLFTAMLQIEMFQSGFLKESYRNRDLKGWNNSAKIQMFEDDNIED